MSSTATPRTTLSGPQHRLATFGKPPRIMGLDIARAIAIIGMIAAHTAVITAELSWGNPATWADLAHGRPSMLFAVLGGISIALMTGGAAGIAREKLPETRMKLIARGLTIFAVGLFLELLGTPVLIILGLYGVLYVLVLPFLRFKRRYLLLTSAIIMLVGPTFLNLWQQIFSSYGPGVNLVLQGPYSLAAWTSLLLLGLAIGRTPLTSVKAALTLTISGLALAAAAYSTSALVGLDDAAYGSSTGMSQEVSAEMGTGQPLGSSSIDINKTDLSGYTCARWSDGTVTCLPGTASSYSSSQISGDEGYMNQWPQFVQRVDPEEMGSTALTSIFFSAPHSGGSLEIAGSAGLALVIIGLCLLAGRFMRILFIPLAALGSMPLSAYALHVLAIWVATGPMGSVADNTFFIYLVLGLLVFATLWMIFMGRGPLERLPLWASRKVSPST